MSEHRHPSLPAHLQASLKPVEDVATALVGRGEKSATSIAESAGLAVRIAERDGESFPLRANLVFARVNLAIEHGVVTDAWAG